MYIYVASSWKNVLYPGIIHVLRKLGHEVYDFRKNGFNWDCIDSNWRQWTPDEYIAALKHPRAIEGYQRDIEALKKCDCVVYVLPCGRSASWEFGYAMGQGKSGYVILLDNEKPDLMFSEATIITSMDQLFDIFSGVIS